MTPAVGRSPPPAASSRRTEAARHPDAGRRRVPAAGSSRQTGTCAAPRDAARQADAGQARRRPSRPASSTNRSGTGSARSSSGTAHEVEIGSRNERPMTRYFPEVVTAVLDNFPERSVIDGEIVVADTVRNTLDFEALQQRIHPAASRVTLLAEQTPASFIAFDLLALGDDDLTAEPLERRRALLEECLAGAKPPVHVTPVTRDLDTAQQLVRPVRGRRPGRADREAARPDLPAGPARHVEDQARAHGRLRRGGLPGAQVRPGRHRLAAARAVRRAGRAGVGRCRRSLSDGGAPGAVRRDAAAGDHLRGPPVELGGARAGRADARARTRPAGGTRARTCRSSRCAPSGSSRCATTTWRAHDSGTPLSSCGGARSATPSRAPTRSSSGRWTSASRTCSTGPDPRNSAGDVADRRSPCVSLPACPPDPRRAGGRPVPHRARRAARPRRPAVRRPVLRHQPRPRHGADRHHFGRPGNRFWPALHRAGFTPRLLRPPSRTSCAARLGITNLVARATARADELTDDELRAGGTGCARW